MEIENSPVNAFGDETAPKEEEVKEVPQEDSKLSPLERMNKMSEELGAYRAKIEASEALQKKKDDDIRAMADKIKSLERGRGHDEGGKKEDDGDVPYKDIKSSKDLSEDERDEMTEDEIKAMDETAELKQKINEMYRMQKKGGEEGGIDVNKTVRDTADSLSGKDTDMTNKIIEAFNGAKFNTADMSAEEIEKAVGLVAGTVQGYKAHHEQGMGAGRGSVAGGGTKEDPYGINKVVEEVARQKTSGDVFSL